MHIRPAEASELIDLRRLILRPGLPRELAMFPGDDDPSTRHFAAEEDGAIVGCVTLHLNRWNDEPAWQLRGMAVAPSHQRQGIGAQLVAAVERSILESGSNLPRLLWCNARVPAVGFYERQGWEVASDVFDVSHAGPHVKMVRRLENDERFQHRL